MHLDEEQLQRLLHRELPPRELSTANEHVAGCGECRRRLAEARQEEEEVLELLRTVDAPPPPVRVEAVALRGELTRAAARTRGSAWLRRAAGVVVAVGIAGAAYAIPGSPLRKWVDAMVEKVGGKPEAPGVATSPGGARASVSGVAVLPGERLSILFTRGGRVLVSLSDAPEVQIQAPAGAAGFTTKADYILISPRDSSATFEIRIPRSAPWVEILVEEKRVFLKEGPRITTSGSTNAVGGYILHLAPSQPSGLSSEGPRPGLRSSQPGP